MGRPIIARVDGLRPGVSPLVSLAANVRFGSLADIVAAVPNVRFTPKSGRGAFNEYTPFCNGPDEVKSPSDRHAAELTLLSVVSAEAATLCC
jgi:hypothetical protein